jgi:hypothetical protein
MLARREVVIQPNSLHYTGNNGYDEEQQTGSTYRRGTNKAVKPKFTRSLLSMMYSLRASFIIVCPAPLMFFTLNLSQN